MPRSEPLLKTGPRLTLVLPMPAAFIDTVILPGRLTANGFNITNYLWIFRTIPRQIPWPPKRSLPLLGCRMWFRAIADNGCAGDTTKQGDHFTISHMQSRRYYTLLWFCFDSVIPPASAAAASNLYLLFWGRYLYHQQCRYSLYHVYTTPGTYIVKHITVSNNNRV